MLERDDDAMNDDSDERRNHDTNDKENALTHLMNLDF